MTFDGSNKSEHANNRREYFNEKIACKRCGKMIRRGNMTTHQKTKKCKAHNDKTAGNTKSPLSSVPSEPDGVTTSGLPAEPHSKNITEINMNQEFDKMAEKFNGKKDEDKEKKYKYKCGECGEYFNIPAEGQKCPFCGQ